MKRSVSGSSQLIASSVSSGHASSVGRMAICRPSVQRSPEASKIKPPPPVVGILSVPLALKVRGDFNFNNKIKVSEMELLEKLEGGGW